MLTIENKNLSETKPLRAVGFLCYFMVSLILLGFIADWITNGFGLASVKILFEASTPMLVVLNGMRNMADTRYYTLQIVENTVIYERRKRTMKMPLNRIKKVYHITSNDISGSTEYLIIFTGWFKKTIFLSDYLMKNNNFDELENYLSEDKVVNVKSKLLSGIMISILTFFLY